MVYFISDNNGHIKIGHTRYIKERMASLQIANPYTLEILLTINSKDIAEFLNCECLLDEVVESTLHLMFGKQRLRGEWFKGGEILKFLNKSKDIMYSIIGEYLPFPQNHKKRKEVIESGLFITGEKDNVPVIRNPFFEISHGSVSVKRLNSLLDDCKIERSSFIEQIGWDVNLLENENGVVSGENYDDAIEIIHTMIRLRTGGGAGGDGTTTSHGILATE